MTLSRTKYGFSNKNTKLARFPLKNGYLKTQHKSQKMETKLINKEKLAEKIVTPETDSLYGHQFCNEDCNHFSMDYCGLFGGNLERVTPFDLYYRCGQCKDCFEEVKNAD